MSKATEYAKVLSGWADRLGFTIGEAAEIVGLARRCGNMNTHAVNGDRHPRVLDTEDKSENSRLWERDLDRLTRKLEDIVGTAGYAVRYNGLYPSLVRKGDDSGNSEIIPLDK